MFVLHRGADLGSSGVSAGALHPPDAQSAVFEAAVLSVAWSGGAVAGLWVSQQGPEPVWVPGDGVSRSCPQQRAQCGRGTRWLCHQLQLAPWHSAHQRFSLLFWSCGPRAGYGAFSCSCSHCCRTAQPGRCRHAPGSCCRPASAQAERKPSLLPNRKVGELRHVCPQGRHFFCLD